MMAAPLSKTRAEVSVKPRSRVSVVEQPGARREDGRMDDEQVLVDQAGHVGQRAESPGAEGGDDVGAVLLLQLLQVLDRVARPDLAKRGGIVGEGAREHHLPHAAQDSGELEARGAVLDVTVRGRPCCDLFPVRHHPLVQLAGHEPGVRSCVHLVDVGSLLLTPREGLPEQPVRVADPAVQRDLHEDDDLAHESSLRGRGAVQPIASVATARVQMPIPSR